MSMSFGGLGGNAAPTGTELKYGETGFILFNREGRKMVGSLKSEYPFGSVKYYYSRMAKTNRHESVDYCFSKATLGDHASYFERAKSLAKNLGSDKDPYVKYGDKILLWGSIGQTGM